MIGDDRGRGREWEEWGRDSEEMKMHHSITQMCATDDVEMLLNDLRAVSTVPVPELQYPPSSL